MFKSTSNFLCNGRNALCEQSNLSQVLQETPIGISVDLSFILMFSVYTKSLAYFASQPSPIDKTLLAYNCSPSFNWKKYLSDDEIASFQKEIAKMGYKFQFITLAGFHTQNIAIFELAEKYRKEGMAAYSRIQQQEFAREKDGYTSVKHQREVGTSYFDAVSNTINSSQSSTTAITRSIESKHF